MISHDSFRDLVHAQQGLHWLHYLNNRFKKREDVEVVTNTSLNEESDAATE
jgi:hypothetical protein